MGDYAAVASAPNEMWVMDFFGPLPEVEMEVAPGVKTTVNSVLVIVDYFSRLAFLQPCRALDGKNVVYYLDRLIYRSGWPKRIRCDGGSHFRNTMVRGWCKRNGVQLDISLPYHPEAQGVVERRNASIGHMMRVLKSVGVSWADELPACEWTLNSTKTKGTGATPYEAFFGMKPRDALAAGLDGQKRTFATYMERGALADELREAVAVASELALGKRRAAHDANVVADNISVGDTVAVWVPGARKLDPQRELGVVVEKAGERGVAFLVKPIDCTDASTDKMQQRAHVYHVERLKLIPSTRALVGTDAAKRALALVKDGLGSVEAIEAIMTQAGRVHGHHRVCVKWRGVDTATAARLNLQWVEAEKLRRNAVLREYCTEKG
jgi:hypothetical protein